jgi:hypothetical protein
MAAKKKITIERVRREVARMDPALKPSDEAFGAAVVCLSAAAIGSTKVTDIARFVGCEPGEIADWVRNLKASGVFRPNGKIAANWFDDGGAMDFWCDVNIALGYMQRAG